MKRHLPQESQHTDIEGDGKCSRSWICWFNSTCCPVQNQCRAPTSLVIDTETDTLRWKRSAKWSSRAKARHRITLPLSCNGKKQFGSQDVQMEMSWSQLPYILRIIWLSYMGVGNIAMRLHGAFLFSSDPQDNFPQQQWQHVGMGGVTLTSGWFQLGFSPVAHEGQLIACSHDSVPKIDGFTCSERYLRSTSTTSTGSLGRQPTSNKSTIHTK